MIELNKIGKNKRGRIWINEEPKAVFWGKNVIKTEICTTCKKGLSEQSVALELCLPRNNSNYALLGVRYSPKENTQKIIVSVESTDCKVEKYHDTIAMSIEDVYIGLLPEYAQAVFDSVCKYMEDVGDIPSGELVFNIASHGEIGSSRGLFSLMGRVVTELITKELDDKNESEIQEAVKEAI